MDERLLARLGLSPKEARLYRATAAAGGGTPAALGKAAGMKRTSAYAMLRSLAEKGFVVEDATRRPRTFSPATPHDIRALISDERKRSEARELVLKKFADELF